MGGIGSARNLIGLSLVSAVLVLGLWVMTEPSDGIVNGFPAGSCLNTQPELSPSFDLCIEADQRMRDLRKGMGLPAGSGAGDQYQSLIDRVMVAGDIHMAAYLTAVRAYSVLEVDVRDTTVRADANAAIFMLAGDDLPGADAIRDLAHAALGALALRGEGRSSARLQFDQISEKGNLAESQKRPDHPPTLFIMAATARLQADYALSSNDIASAIRHADAASRAYRAINSPRTASLVQMELSEAVASKDKDAALAFMSRAVEIACDNGADESYCGFVGSWARQLRESIDATAN